MPWADRSAAYSVQRHRRLLPLPKALWAALLTYRESPNKRKTSASTSGVILTAIYGFAVYFIRGISLEVTATYIYLSMFFSFAVLFPDMQVLLFYCIPIKIKYLAFLDAALFAVAVITTSFPLNLLPVVAVLNFFIFCGGQLWSKRPRRSSKNTVNFRRESQRIRRQQEQKLYNHKCAVCGRTDTDFPELEFRYCSRCQGYHCFCQDHINNHIHFTE